MKKNLGFSGCVDGWRGARAASLALLASVTLTACEWSSNGVFDLACHPDEPDLALVDLGLEPAKPPPLDLSKLPVEIVKRHFHGATLMRSRLVRYDFAGVQAHWDGLQAMTDPTERMRALLRSMDALSGKGLYVLQAAQRWHALQPDSPAAQLMLGAAYVKASAEIRGDQSMAETPYEQLRWMGERYALGWNLLEPLTRRADAYGDAARLASIHGHFSFGDSARGWADFWTLVQKAPQYEWLYVHALNYARPIWAGHASEDRYKAVLDLAEANRLPAVHLTNLRQMVANDRNPIEKNPVPAAWRPYWEQRVQQAPTVANHASWLASEMRLQNWRKVEEISAKLLELNPERPDGWNSRAYALERLGRLDEAFDALLAAVMVGDDWAMGRLVDAYSRGGYGRPSNDWSTLYEYCKLGVALGLPSAANCMGAAHTDGFSGGPRNDREALAWHLLGARGGNANSEHDIFVLLPRVVPANTVGLDVPAVSSHWLERAVTGGHEPAKVKLSALAQAVPNSRLGCRVQTWLIQVAEAVAYLRSLFIWL